MEGPNKIKRANKKEEFTTLLPACLLEWSHIPSHLIASISSPGPQAFQLELNYITGFPGSPVSGQQNVGLLSLQNHGSQFLETNHVCVCACVCMCSYKYILLFILYIFPTDAVSPN